MPTTRVAWIARIQNVRPSRCISQGLQDLGVVSFAFGEKGLGQLEVDRVLQFTNVRLLAHRHPHDRFERASDGFIVHQRYSDGRLANSSLSVWSIKIINNTCSFGIGQSA